MQRFLVVKVNWKSSVFNDNQTNLNIEEIKEIVVKASESVHPKTCLHFASRWHHTGKNNRHILVCWLYSCIYHSQTWMLVFIININTYNVKQRIRFISRTTAAATVHWWQKLGSVSNCSGVLKRSAATGKINVLTTSHTITHRRTDELGNMLFKNKTGKTASLMNYNKSQRKQNELILIRRHFSAFCGVTY